MPPEKFGKSGQFQVETAFQPPNFTTTIRPYADSVFLGGGERVKIGGEFERTKYVIVHFPVTTLSQLKAMTGNQNLQKILVQFATGERGEFENFLNQLPREMLTGALTDILNMYANDGDSSVMRKHITMAVAGYVPHSEKDHGQSTNRQ